MTTRERGLAAILSVQQSELIFSDTGK